MYAECNNANDICYMYYILYIYVLQLFLLCNLIGGFLGVFFLSSCWAVQCSISAVLYLLLLILYWFGHLIYEYWKGHMLD